MSAQTAGTRGKSAIGRTDATCPHCKQALPKKPGRKAKCAHCGNFMYVRTRPSDRQRVLVTESEVAQIEALWELRRENVAAFGLSGRRIGEREAFERERAALTAKFGGPPADRDVRWSLLIKQRNKHLSEGDWGLYRNIRLDMAEVLQADGRLEAALAAYFEVCYLDLNGPRNAGEIMDSRLLRKYPPFSPESASLSPGLFRRVKRLLGQLDLDSARAGKLFLEHVREHCCHLDLPLTPEEAWPPIEREAFG